MDIDEIWVRISRWRMRLICILRIIKKRILNRKNTGYTVPVIFSVIGNRTTAAQTVKNGHIFSVSTATVMLITVDSKKTICL